MNQKQNAISLARVLAFPLFGESQAWNLVKHQPGWKCDHEDMNNRLCLTNGFNVDRAAGFGSCRLVRHSSSYVKSEQHQLGKRCAGNNRLDHKQQMNEILKYAEL